MTAFRPAPPPAPHIAQDFNSLLKLMLAPAEPDGPGQNGIGPDMAGSPGRPGLADPFSRLDFNARGDLSIALIRAWATVGDILSFYQQEIAREGYLGTAEERLSVIELLRQIGYEFRPLSAAGTALALTVRAGRDTGPDIVVAGGLVAQTVPVGSQQPISFETLGPVTAREAWNSLAPVVATQLFVAPLTQGATSVQLDGLRTGLRVGSGLFLEIPGTGGGPPTALFRQVAALETDATAALTLVHWAKPLSLPAGVAEVKQYQVFAALPSCGLLGDTRKPWDQLPLSARRALGTPLGGVCRSMAPAPVATGTAAARGWDQDGKGLPFLPVPILATGPDGQCLAATAQGLFQQAAGKADWVPFGLGPARRPIQALFVDDQGQIYVAGGRGRIYRSTDNGENWDVIGSATLQRPGLFGRLRAPLPLPDMVIRALAVATDPRSGAPVILAGSDKGALTIDAVGAGWKGMNLGFPGYSAATGLANVSVQAVQMLPDGSWLAATDKGLFRAARAGATWQSLSIAQSPGQTAPVWLARLRLWLARGLAALGRGLTWLLTPLRRLLGGIGRPFAQPADPSSSPAPSPLPRTTKGLDSSCLLCLPAASASFGQAAAPMQLLAGTARGILASQDGGLGWYPASEGLGIGPDPTPPAITALCRAGTALWAAGAAGVWCRDLTQTQWTAANGALQPLFLIPAASQTDWPTAFAAHGLDFARLEVSGTLASGLTLVDRAQGLVLRASRLGDQVLVARDDRLPSGPVTALVSTAAGTVHAAVGWSGVAEPDWPGATVLTGSLDLDRRLADASDPAWVGLVAQDTTTTTELCLPLFGQEVVAATDFGQSRTVTRLATGGPLVPLDIDRRQTSVFLSAGTLPVFSRRRPLPTPVCGTRLALQGRVEGLHAGQRLALTGQSIGLRAVGTPGGLYRIAAGKAVRIGCPGQTVLALAEAGDTVLAATADQMFAVTAGAVSDLVGSTTDLDAAPGQRMFTEWTTRNGLDLAGAEAGGTFAPVTAMTTLAPDKALVAGKTGVALLSGTGWQPLARPPAPVTALAAEDDRILVGTGAGVFQLTKDAALPLGLDTFGITCLAIASDGTLVAGTDWGLFRRDAGGQWLALGLGRSRLSALLALPGGTLWAGTREDGLYLSQDFGRSWARVATGLDRRIQALAVGSDGAVLVGTAAALVLADPNRGPALAFTQPLVLSFDRMVAPTLDGGTLPAALAKALAAALHEAGLPGGPVSLSVRVLRPGALWVLPCSPGPDLMIQDTGTALEITRSCLFQPLAAPHPTGDGWSLWTLRGSDGATGRFAAPEGTLVFDNAPSDFADIGEIIELAGPGQPDTLSGDSVTQLTLTAPLGMVFDAATTSINGNVALAVAGRGITAEPIGSGNAVLVDQRFALLQPPLAALPADTPEGLVSSLQIEVRAGSSTGRLPVAQASPPLSPEAPIPATWTEVPSLAGAVPDATVYTTRTDETGRTQVIFGDGINGARLPTGSANVVASYRSGGGSAGNVAAGAVRRMSAGPASVRGVINPIPAAGGENAEDLTSARIKGPRSTRALGRLVSLSDYQDFAQGFAGVGQALARQLWDGHGWQIHLTISDAKGGSPTADSPLATRLAASITSHRADVFKLSVDGYQLILFDVAARLTLRPGNASGPVLRRLSAALTARFAPVERRFAQSAAASDIVALLQDDPAVRAVDLTGFAVSGASAQLQAVLPASPARFDPGLNGIHPAEVLAINPTGITLSLATDA